MTPKLIYRDMHGVLATVPLSSQEVLIGRQENCAVCSRDPLVSSIHCQISRQGDAWVVEDRQSANHTYLNDDETPVTRRALRDRDVIRCGPLWIQCLLPQPPATEPARPPAEGGRTEQELTQVSKELERTKQKLESTLKERDALRNERELVRQALLDATEQLRAEQSVSETLRNDIQDRDVKLAAALEHLKTLDAEALNRSSELSQSRADRDSLQKRLAAATGSLEEVQQRNSVLFDNLNKFHQEHDALIAISQEKDRIIDGLHSGPIEQEVKLREQGGRLEMLERQVHEVRVDRDRYKDEFQQRRLALEEAEEELRRLRQTSERFERIINSQQKEGPELPGLIKDNAALRDEIQELKHKLKNLGEKVQVLYEGIQSTLMDLNERALAVQRRYATLEAAVADREGARLLTRTIEEIVDQAHNAQGQLRGLRRLMG